MKTAITTLVATLALAAPAAAADLHGSDLNPTHEQSSLGCSSYPCTLAQEHFANWESALIDGPGVITGWKVKLAPGTKATLKVLGTNADGDYYVSDTGPTVTGTGGVVSVDSRVRLLFDSYYAGIELGSGSVLADYDPDDAGPSTMVFEGALDASGHQPAANAAHELLSQVKVEPDADADGLGDETQDGCVGCSGGGGDPAPAPNDPGSGPQPLPPAPSDDPTPAIGKRVDPYEAELAKRPPVKLTVDPRAFFDENRSKPIVSTYFANEGRYPVKGSVRLLDGKQPVGGSYSIEVATDSSSMQSFFVSKKLASKLRRGHKVKLTFVASLTGNDGTRSSVRKTVTVSSRGVTRKFDGTYSGTAGLKITVAKGLITNVHGDVRTFCSASNKFLYRTLGTAEGFPAAVSRSGSFKVKGNFDKDSVSYSGTLKRNGSASGKLSLFHTELTFGDGLGIDQCAGASNWTAKRGKSAAR